MRTINLESYSAGDESARRRYTTANEAVSRALGRRKIAVRAALVRPPVTAYFTRSKGVPPPPPHPRLLMLPILRIGALAFSLGALVPGSPVRAHAARADSIAVTTAVTRFHDALTAGDSVRAVATLASDALILESGAIETRAEYLGHHLGADMAASKDSKGTRTVVQVRVAGDAAYVVSRTVTPPTGEEGSTGSQMAELMVLERTTTGWKIQAIHWSSRRRRS